MKNIKRKPVVSRLYGKLLKDIGLTVEKAKLGVSYAINHELVKVNWEIGRHIVEFEQKGNEKAEYGSKLLANLSRDLKRAHGAGFSKSSVYISREFYLNYPIFQTLSGKLSWSHFVILTGIKDKGRRIFYEGNAISENWSVRELQRAINASLYERFALKKNMKMLSNSTNESRARPNYHEAIKDPYVLDFLGLAGRKYISEKKLEQRLIDNMQQFLLELGKGFAFVARQYKISLRTKHFYIDLVFYHRILKCFVLLELKTRPVKHTDIGQMNLYLNYFKAEENLPDDNDPIGIILSAEKDEFLVEYALGGLSNKIFVSKYQLHLPKKKQLEERLKTISEVR